MLNKLFSIIFSFVSYILFVLVVISPSSEHIEISDNYLNISLVCSVIGIIFGIMERNKVASIVLIIVAMIPIIVFISLVVFAFLIA